VNKFTLEIFEKYPLVTFYSVRWEGSELSETDKFIKKILYDKTEHKIDLQEILTLVETMGEENGAKNIYFTRHEDEATALPPNKNLVVRGIEIPFYQNKLRLYCVRINEYIVVLFNGGVKSSQTIQGSSDLVMKFRDAKLFAKRIWQAIQEKDILIVPSSQELKTSLGDEEIFL
jgi:hypothetical protein